MNIAKSSKPGDSDKNAKKTLFFQPKLTVNQPNDTYEQEADAMADKVMRMGDTQSSFFKPNPNNAIQRKCQACEEEETHVHRKEGDGNEVQGSNELDSYVSSLSSSGQQISQTSRSFFEPRFGHDFSNVKIHTDAVAAKSAQSINALAYTTGNNIVFNSGQYSPDSDSGKKLMAHELTHIVQQTGSVQTKISNNVTNNTVYRQSGWADGTNINKGELNIDKDGKAVPTAGSTVLRIPVDGLKEGNQVESTKKPLNGQEVPVLTTEKAVGKAIVIIPAGLDPKKPVEVLLYLHGYYEGYRESNNAVMDINRDKMEQQILASGHTQMIGILPQGTTHSGFGVNGFHSDAYITEVLTKIQSGQSWVSLPVIERIILSAQSGGGNTVEDLLNSTKGSQLSSKTTEIVLFEAINGPKELAAIKNWITTQIARDVTNLKTGSAADHTAYLAKSARFRGYYTPKGTYVARYKDLDAYIQDQFKSVVDAAKLASQEADAIKENYKVIETTDAGADHNNIIGTNNRLQYALSALPPMVTAPAATPPTVTPPAIQPKLKDNGLNDQYVQPVNRQIVQRKPGNVIQRFESLTPMHSDEIVNGQDKYANQTFSTTGDPIVIGSDKQPGSKKTLDKDLSIFVPKNVVAGQNQVHIFFTPFVASSPDGPANFIAEQGLRGASDASAWILIGVPALEGVQPNFVTINTAEVQKCLSSINRPTKIDALRLSAHSRGHRGLENTIGKTPGSTPLLDLSLVQKISVFDASYHDLGQALTSHKKDLTAMADPANPGQFKQDSLNLYDVTVANISGYKGIQLEPRAIRALSYTRLIQEGLNKAWISATDLNVLPNNIKDATNAILGKLPARSTFSTKSPPPGGQTNIKDFYGDATNHQNLMLIDGKEIKKLITDKHLDNNEGFNADIDAHHWFVTELAHEAVE